MIITNNLTFSNPFPSVFTFFPTAGYVFNDFTLVFTSITSFGITVPTLYDGVEVIYVATLLSGNTFVGAPISAGVTITTIGGALGLSESYQDFGNNSNELSLIVRATNSTRTGNLWLFDYSAYNPCFANTNGNLFYWTLRINPLRNGEDLV